MTSHLVLTDALPDHAHALTGARFSRLVGGNCSVGLFTDREAASEAADKLARAGLGVEISNPADA